MATRYWQCTPRNCGTSSIWAAYYGYDLAGNVTSWNHPAGFTITNTLSAAGQVTQVASSWSDSSHPAVLAQNVLYNAAGAVTSLQNGCVGTGCTSRQETYFYNKRLQIAVAELGTSSNHAADSCRIYNYYVGVANVSACSESPSAWPTGTNDNGNVAGYYFNDIDNTGLSHKATYGYDAVNRLSSASATGNITYSKTYNYTGDGSNGKYGNLGCSPAGPGCVGFSYSAVTNQITTSGYGYDAAGNLTGDGTYTYQWDAEAHLTAVVDGLQRTVSANTYNALGQRVRDVTLSNTTDEAYGADGSLLWRYTGDSNARSFVPVGGGILAEYYSGGTLFDHPDELGSLSASTLHNGNACQERLYYPFGEAWTGAGNCGLHQTFARLPDYDPETDQYNTLNRHYSPNGRWLSPDPGGIKVLHLDDPQTWNMYAYVRNNPTTLTDPTGLGMDFSGWGEASASFSTPGSIGGDLTMPETLVKAPPPQEPKPPKPPEPAQKQGQTQEHTTKSSEMVMRGKDDTIIFHQEKTVTTITKDADGNVMSQTETKTVINATYSIKGGTPKFLKATFGLGQAGAEQAFGGPSRVYDTLGSIIRNEGRVKFGVTVASGAAAGPELVGEAAAANYGRALFVAVRELLVKILLHDK